MDIEQCVRETRALLKVNDEIFDRCKKSQRKTQREFVVRDPRTRYKKIFFARKGFDAVRVHHTGTSTQIVTHYERSTKCFDMNFLGDLPDELKDLVGLKFCAEFAINMFVDCNAIFQRAFTLHDDVLGPFLTRFKRHIESIHVRLGEIESWLLEPAGNLKYLEETFGIQDLEGAFHKSTWEDAKHVCECPEGAHAWDERCLGCDRLLSSHGRCYHGASNRYVRTCANASTYSFVCSKTPYVLKSFRDSGKHERTFAIADERDRRKLGKFLDFMAE